MHGRDVRESGGEHITIAHTAASFLASTLQGLQCFVPHRFSVPHTAAPAAKHWVQTPPTPPPNLSLTQQQSPPTREAKAQGEHVGDGTRRSQLLWGQQQDNTGTHAEHHAAQEQRTAQGSRGVNQQVVTY